MKPNAIKAPNPKRQKGPLVLEPGGVVKRYRTIVADPPWRYEQFVASRTPSRGKSWRTPPPYSMMDVAEIKRVPVSSLADDDARLFLWATSRYLMAAGEIAVTWGFRYRQTFVWNKIGRLVPLPAPLAPNHAEFLLVAERGKPQRIGTWTSSVITAPRGDHSAKPEAFLDMVERVSPGPYVELFARRARFGWDCWGDESLGTADLPWGKTAEELG